MIVKQYNATPADWAQMPLVLTVKEMARVLGIGQRKAYELVEEPGFPIVKLGGCYRVNTAGLDVYSHVFPGMKEAAVNQLSALLKEERNDKIAAHKVGSESDKREGSIKTTDKVNEAKLIYLSSYKKYHKISKLCEGAAITAPFSFHTGS